MKITDIQLGQLSIPLKTPFKTALRIVKQVKDVLVRIHTDTGHVGYGSAAPTALITGDTTDSIKDAIEGYIKKRIIGLSIDNFEEIMQKLQKSLVKNTQNLAQSRTTVIFNNESFSWRKLTPLECERLQTIPDNYTLVPHPHFKGRMMSDSRRYMMIGMIQSQQLRD